MAWKTILINRKKIWKKKAKLFKGILGGSWFVLVINRPAEPWLFYNHFSVEGLLTWPTPSSFLPFFLCVKKLDKVVELVGGGSVINGAYPV